VFVAICKICGFVTYSKSFVALRRNMVLHYAKHVCGDLMLKYSISRGTCVKKVFEKVREGENFEKYFDVREVK
jgi:hypothetical protein